MLWASHALADTTVSSQSTTVKTSTANNGQPDNVIISGSVTPPSGVGVLLDSNNTVTNNGAINIPNASNSAGIVAQGGHTGGVTNTGTITLDETSTAKDTDGDGIIDGPFANGANRFGIQVTGPAPFTGPISNTGTITIIGNGSAAMSVETALTGALSSTGTLVVTGSNTYGLHAAGPVSGDVTVRGVITATGEGAQGVVLGGDVGGGVLLQSAITATGYRFTTVPTDPTTLSHLDGDDLLQGGPAVSIAGSVGRGVLVDVPPTLDPNNPDVDGDGVPDANETTGTIISYGGAPALQVGAVGRDITLGDVGTGGAAFGIVNKGIINGSGLYAGVAATGLQVGVSGGGAVNLTGGISNTGSIVSTALGGSTAVDIGAGATSPVIYNGGTISSNATTDSAVQSRGVAIEAGAHVDVLQNSGTIIAGVVGATGDAVAIVDNSGTLSRIETTGQITSTVTTSATSTALPTGKQIALDAHLNTGGLYFWQYQGVAGTAAPNTTGNVLLGSGADRLDILAGTLTGDVSFGAGANALNIDGAAKVAGAVTADGGTLALSVATGSLTINNAPHLNLTSLTLGPASQLVVTVDPAANAATLLDVAGAANIADGAKIGVRLASILQGDASYTLIRANQLNAGTIDSTLLGSTPYLYTASLAENAAAGTVSVNLSLKSATDLALPAAIAQAYLPVLQAADRDQVLRSAVLAQTDRAGLLRIYNQMLPDHSGTVFQMAELATQEFAKPLDEREDTEGGGAWLQEVNYGVVQDGQGDIPGYKAWGLGLVGGVEAPATRLGVFGVTMAAASNSSRDDDRNSNQKLTSNILQLGGYWRVTEGPFTANAHVGGDYLKMSGDRVVSVHDDSGTLLFGGTATGHWSGTGVNARFRVAYEGHLGDFFVRPQVGVDYFDLHEDGYAEYGGGDALDLTVSGRTSSRLSGFAGLGLGAVWSGPDGTFGPELLLGYRDVVSDNLGDTTARFTAGGDSFTLAADQVGGQGGVVRLALKGENGFGGFAIEGGAEARDSLTIYDLRLSAHFAF